MKMVWCDQPNTKYSTYPGNCAKLVINHWFLPLEYWALNNDFFQIGLGEWKSTLLSLCTSLTAATDTCSWAYFSVTEVAGERADSQEIDIHRMCPIHLIFKPFSGESPFGEHICGQTSIFTLPIWKGLCPHLLPSLLVTVFQRTPFKSLTIHQNH